MNVYEELINKKTKLSLIGLGYVGMPIAVAFAKKIDVIGFDINPEKIELYKKGIDVTKEVGNEALKVTKVEFTSNEEELQNETQKFENKILGQDEGKNIYIKKGPYGFYIQKGEDSTKKDEKPKRVGIPKTNKEPQNLTLEQAKALLSLPRLIGKHPEDNGEIKANIGPFGPYLMYNKAFYSVKNDDILTIELPKAVMIIEEGKKNKKAKAETKKEETKEKQTEKKTVKKITKTKTSKK